MTQETQRKIAQLNNAVPLGKLSIKGRWSKKKDKESAEKKDTPMAED